MSLHPANEAQRARLLSAEHWLCTERAKLYTEAHRETVGAHPSWRAARAFRHHSLPKLGFSSVLV